MKTLNSLVLFTITILTLSSCATDENLLPEEKPLDLLKSYTVKRDATGAYYLDYDVTNNVKVDNLKDIATNTNQIYLHSSGNESSRKVSEALAIENGELNINFIDANTDKQQPRITIIDDDIILGENTDGNEEMLAEYSITNNANGTFTLDFKVKDKVEADFVYNEKNDTYEVHLEKGNGYESNYSRILKKQIGKPLKFDFVNHTNNRSNTSRKPRRKPRGVIGNGGDNNERNT